MRDGIGGEIAELRGRLGAAITSKGADTPI
jgi:hypothetical protein